MAPAVPPRRHLVLELVIPEGTDMFDIGAPAEQGGLFSPF
jgi:hypothetical protein